MTSHENSFATCWEASSPTFIAPTSTILIVESSGSTSEIGNMVGFPALRALPAAPVLGIQVLVGSHAQLRRALRCRLLAGGHANELPAPVHFRRAKRQMQDGFKNQYRRAIAREHRRVMPQLLQLLQDRAAQPFGGLPGAGKRFVA